MQRMMPKGLRKFLPTLCCAERKKPCTEEGAESSASVRGGGGGGGSDVSAAGSVPPNKQQLEARLLKNEGADDAWRKELFQKARILVLGRSGVGKTTLIRLIVGEDGPQSVSEGVAGVQNINKEFFYYSEEQGVPLIIHDSNGIDVKGKERVNEIKAFLNKHQKGDDFTERIHVVWYVISAVDSRCVDDGDVMKIISEYKIPLLLIMTHNDYEKVKVTDAVLDQLLQSAYPEDEEREDVKKLMVRVSNDGVSMGANKELVIDESKQDTEGLKLVAKRTQQLMDKKLRHTWIAAQAEGKLDETAEIIVGNPTGVKQGIINEGDGLAEGSKLLCAVQIWRKHCVWCCTDLVKTSCMQLCARKR